MCMYGLVYMYIYTSWPSPQTRPTSSDTPVEIGTPSSIYKYHIYKYHSLIKWTRAPERSRWFESWGRETTKWAWRIFSFKKWEHLREREEEREKTYVKGHSSQTERTVPMTKSGTIWATKLIIRVLDYSLKNKINISNSILINKWLNKQMINRKKG